MHSNRVLRISCKKQHCVDCKLENYGQRSRVVVHHWKISKLDWSLFSFERQHININKLVVAHVVNLDFE